MDYTHLYIAQVMIEARTGMSIASGLENDVFDTALVQDANGLPAIPGTTIAGVLRSLYVDEFGQEKAGSLFGYQKRKSEDAEYDSRGQTSRVHVSWGDVVDQNNVPVRGLKPFSDVSNDVVLSRLWQVANDFPIVRDHVRIDHRGVADAQGHGKFDRSVLPAGTRFVFELTLQGDQDCGEVWNNVLSLLFSPKFKLGGRTRSGLGAIDIVQVREQCVELKNAVTVSDSAWKVLEPESVNSNKFERLDLDLKPENFWLFGKGRVSLLHGREKDADVLSVTEDKLSWSGDAATFIPHILVAGSGVKGALRHRSVFHYNCLKMRSDEAYMADDDPGPIRELFGSVKQEKEAGGAGHAGVVHIDDAYVPLEGNPVRPSVNMHNSIDRVTGGVRGSVLFSEEALWKGTIPISISLLLHGDVKIHKVNSDAISALKLAVKDLAEGRLSIGAGSNKGYGFMQASLPDDFKSLWNSMGDGNA